jgi:hypothetical protein
MQLIDLLDGEKKRRWAGLWRKGKQPKWLRLERMEGPSFIFWTLHLLAGRKTSSIWWLALVGRKNKEGDEWWRQ